MGECLCELVTSLRIPGEKIPHPAVIKEIERRRRDQYVPEQPELPIYIPTPYWPPGEDDEKDDDQKRGVEIIQFYRF